MSNVFHWKLKSWAVLKQSWRAAWMQRALEKSHRNKHMPLKLVKTIKKALCSVAQNYLMHFGMKNGDFCSRVFKKLWVTPGMRHQPDAAVEEAKVTHSYITIRDHWALTWSSWDKPGHVGWRKRKSNSQRCRKFIPEIDRIFSFMQENKLKKKKRK